MLSRVKRFLFIDNTANNVLQVAANSSQLTFTIRDDMNTVLAKWTVPISGKLLAKPSREYPRSIISFPDVVEWSKRCRSTVNLILQSDYFKSTDNYVATSHVIHSLGQFSFSCSSNDDGVVTVFCFDNANDTCATFEFNDGIITLAKAAWDFKMCYYTIIVQYLIDNFDVITSNQD